MRFDSRDLKQLEGSHAEHDMRSLRHRSESVWPAALPSPLGL